MKIRLLKILNEESGNAFNTVVPRKSTYSPSSNIDNAALVIFDAILPLH